MEILYICLFIVVIYLLITNKTDLNEKIAALEFRIQELQTLLKRSIEKPPTVESEKPLVKPAPPIAESKPAPPIPVPEKIEQHKEVIQEPIPVIRQPIKTNNPAPPPPRQWQPEPEPKLSFFERYPDLEKFIGENLVNKIGIAILVLAIGFFVKYAIDNNWIGPIGRVGIGVLCGGILIGIAHRLRNSYKAFSSVLVGGGLAILYFTITLAYHEFHLFNQTTSFIIMVVITAFAVVLSLLYDKQELAVTALIGGLSSPFMVSSGHANYNALFLYMVVLNTGLLVIAYYKAWRILNASAFGLTVIIFSGVSYTLSGPTYLTGLIYATILYLLFFTINVANNVKENKKFIASDFSILLINTALYFAAGLYLLTEMKHEELRGLFSAALGVINLVLSFILFRNKKVDSNILYLLIGITLTFVSLTAPIQLHGHNITLFWAAEAVLLYWLHLRSKIQLMKLTSLLVWGAMLLSLFMDWNVVYSTSTILIIIANKGFITTLVAAVSSCLLSVLVKRDDSDQVYGLSINGSIYQYLAFVLLFLSGLLEVNHQFLSRYPDSGLNSIYLMLYVPAFVFISFMLIKKFGYAVYQWPIAAGIMAITVAIYLIFTQAFFDAQYAMLLGHVSTTHFIAHWIGAIFLVLIFYNLIVIARDDLAEDMQNIAGWLLSGAVVAFVSIEACLASILLFYSATETADRIETVYIKVGLPILWGVASFALMWLGMRYKVRNLRIISLSLFSLTLLKLFIFDIKDIPPAGKIAAFFCLGVLLLIISFMYQKVKKIIVDDEAAKHE